MGKDQACALPSWPLEWQQFSEGCSTGQFSGEIGDYRWKQLLPPEMIAT